jgi:ATP synthase protein I
VSRNESNKPEDAWREYASYGSLGLELAVTVLVCAYLGYRLYLYFHTTPWLMIVGVFLGFIAGVYTIYKRAVAGEALK